MPSLYIHKCSATDPETLGEGEGRNIKYKPRALGFSIQGVICVAYTLWKFESNDAFNYGDITCQNFGQNLAKDPPPPPLSPLVAHLVDKVGTKDPPLPPPPLVAHLVDNVGTKDPPRPPPPPIGRFERAVSNRNSNCLLVYNYFWQAGGWGHGSLTHPLPWIRYWSSFRSILACVILIPINKYSSADRGSFFMF